MTTRHQYKISLKQNNTNNKNLTANNNGGCNEIYTQATNENWRDMVIALVNKIKEPSDVAPDDEFSVTNSSNPANANLRNTSHLRRTHHVASASTAIAPVSSLDLALHQLRLGCFIVSSTH